LFCKDEACESREPSEERCSIESDSDDSPCYYYNNKCLNECTIRNTHTDFNSKKCIDNECEKRNSINGSCEMPSDKTSSHCYFNAGECLSTCPDGTEINNNSLVSSCIKIAEPIPPKEVAEFSWWFYVVIGGGLFLIIIVIIVILVVYRQKKKKKKLRNNEMVFYVDV
jgi:hypothetical protein